MLTAKKPAKTSPNCAQNRNIKINCLCLKMKEEGKEKEDAERRYTLEMSFLLFVYYDALARTFVVML